MKKLNIIAAGLGAALLSTTAMAGKVQPALVDVDLAGLTAGGDMTSARYSDNKEEFIGCGIRKIEDGVGGIISFGFCQAEDAAGERAFCNTQNVGLLDGLSANGDYGYITFNWNADGECTRVGFSNQSFYLPTGLGAN
jgi:hypothetical protein